MAYTPTVPNNMISAGPPPMSYALRRKRDLYDYMRILSGLEEQQFDDIMDELEHSEQGKKAFKNFIIQLKLVTADNLVDKAKQKKELATQHAATVHARIARMEASRKALKDFSKGIDRTKKARDFPDQKQIMEAIDEGYLRRTLFGYLKPTELAFK